MTAEQKGEDGTARELLSQARDPRTRQAALEAIHARYGQRLLRYCAARLNEKDFAADAVQDTFLELTAHFAAGKTVNDSLEGFLFAIARRRVTRYMRGGTPGKGHRPGPDLLTLTGDQDPADDDRFHAAAIAVAEDEMGVERVRRMLDRHVVPSLSERHRRIYENSVRRGLTGDAFAEALNTTTEAAKRDLNYVRTKVIVKAVPAFLLYRNSVEHRGERCPELDRIVAAGLLDSDPDTGFSEKLRQDITKHFDTCATCGKCRVCGPLQRRLLAELTPVLISILYAAEVRDRTIDAIRRVCAQRTVITPDSGPSDQRRPDDGVSRRRPVLTAGAVLLVMLLLIVGGVLLWPRGNRHHTAPPVAMPLVAYATTTAVGVRGQTGGPRTLASVPSGDRVVQMMWSADARRLAWMTQNTDGQTMRLNTADIATGAVHSAVCTLCYGMALAGDRLLTTLEQSVVGVFSTTPTIRPVTSPVRGLPKADSANTDATVTRVLGSIESGRYAVVHWSDGVDSGLYRVDAGGEATRLVAGSAIVPATAMSLSPDHKLLLYGGARHTGGDVCRPSDTVAVDDLTTGTQRAVDLPTDTTRPWRALSAWADDQRSVYVTAVQQPGQCGTGYRSGAPAPVSPHIYRLDGSRWTDLGVTAVAGEARHGWKLTATGTIPPADLVSGQTRPSTYTSLTATDGRTTVDLGTGLTAYAWAPS